MLNSTVIALIVAIVYMVIFSFIWGKTHQAKTETKVETIEVPTKVDTYGIMLEAFEGLAKIYDENNIKSNTKAYKLLHAQIDTIKDAE